MSAEEAQALLKENHEAIFAAVVQRFGDMEGIPNARVESVEQRDGATVMTVSCHYDGFDDCYDAREDAWDFELHHDGQEFRVV